MHFLLSVSFRMINGYKSYKTADASSFNWFDLLYTPTHGTIWFKLQWIATCCSAYIVQWKVTFSSIFVTIVSLSLPPVRPKWFPEFFRFICCINVLGVFQNRSLPEHFPSIQELHTRLSVFKRQNWRLCICISIHFVSL